ncbi:MAG: hypothetical protein IPJ55_15945 [Chloracidobacterium sp.]|nr:hypothetical protein [Chloracidobacterium sp.]
MSLSLCPVFDALTPLASVDVLLLPEVKLNPILALPSQPSTIPIYRPPKSRAFGFGVAGVAGFIVDSDVAFAGSAVEAEDTLFIVSDVSAGRSPDAEIFVTGRSISIVSIYSIAIRIRPAY